MRIPARCPACAPDERPPPAAPAGAPVPGMMVPLALACLWLIAANLIAMVPSRDHHWRAAYALIALGIPLLGWLTLTAGPLWGMAFLAAGASLLRWPLVYLWRWLRRP